MDMTLLSTTNDIEQLRTMALTMVQKVVSENAEKDQRIRLLEEALLLARQQRFGRKTEMLSGLQRQLFEEDTEADTHVLPLIRSTCDEVFTGSPAIFSHIANGNITGSAMDLTGS